MKRITNLIAVSITAALISGTAYADTQPASDWYTGISGDVTWQNSDTGGGGNIAIGRRFWATELGDFRLEAEAGYHDISPSHYYTYMGNLYYDFNLSPSGPWKTMPYIGGGLGDATVHFSQSDSTGRYSEQDDVFAYQLMAGLNFVNDSAPNTEWYIGYRYLGSDNVSGTDNAGISTSDRLKANNVELGLRFHF